MTSLFLLAALLVPTLDSARGRQEKPVPRKGPKAEARIVAIRPEKSEVKVGETFKVAFDLEITPGWYIYPTVKTTTGTETKIVLEAAEVAGKVEEPKAKVHPKEDDVEAYEYHDGRITIAVPVYLRKGPKPGPFEVKGVLDYQICATSCIPRKDPFSFTVKVMEGEVEPPPSDTPPPLKVLSVSPGKTQVRAGEIFQVTFEVEVPGGWHIYPTYPNRSRVGEPTKFLFKEAEVSGKVAEPKAKVHPAQGAEPEYDYHDGKVAFTVPFRLKPGLRPGPLEVKGQIDYMICNPITCVPADVPASFSLTVLEGQAPTADASFLTMLGLAFLGGLLLNVMPCVLPVLTIKLFSIVEQKDVTSGARHGAALAYTAGVLLCLNAFALAVVVLRSLGSQVGWGFQFQEPAFVIALTTIIFVFALSLVGVFEVPALGTGVAAKAGRKQGAAGHLVTGLFVTLVATPCSAPFLGTGLGFAFTLSGWGVFLFFSAAGLGLALPFLVIGFVPVLFRFLPKPGPWLEVFKKVMGFTLLATAVWLIDSIGSLTGQAGVIGFLAFLTAVSIGAWIYGTWGSQGSSTRSRIVSVAAAAALAVLGGKFFLVTQVEEAKPESSSGFRTEGLDFSGRIPWQPFSNENVAALRRLKKPAFIDFTADW